jgi:hypothetical protein
VQVSNSYEKEQNYNMEDNMKRDLIKKKGHVNRRLSGGDCKNYWCNAGKSRGASPRISLRISPRIIDSSVHTVIVMKIQALSKTTVANNE